MGVLPERKKDRSSNGPLMMKVVTRHPHPGRKGKEGGATSQRYVRSFIPDLGSSSGGGEQLDYDTNTIQCAAQNRDRPSQR